MDLFYTVLITLNITCAFLILMSGLRQQKIYLLSLALLNIFMVFFHYFSWQFHSSNTIEEALSYSNFQTSLVVLALPLMTFTFGKWCKYKYTNQLSLIFLVAVLIILTISSFSEYSLRFGQGVELVHYKSIFGDELTILKGQSSTSFMLLHLIHALNFGLLILFAVRLFKLKNNTLALSLIILLCLQIICTYAGYKIDRLDWKVFYIGGLPLSIFSIFCTALISAFYKSASIKLVEQKEENTKLEDAISQLAHGVSSTNSDGFYVQLAHMIYGFANADIVLLGKVVEKETKQIQSLAVLKNGVAVKNFSYELKGTPCDTVMGNKTCIYSQGVASLYPDDKILKELGIESYIGVPLLNQEQEIVGVLALLYTVPTDPKPSLVNGLKIFASRIGTEIKRNELEQKLIGMAYYDYESKLPNRAKLLDVINEKYFECQKTNKNSLFMLIDLDQFGDVNRQYGPEIGDQVIRQLGLRLQHYSSTDIFIARNSGDEFAIIISNISGEVTSLLNVHWRAIKAIINETCIIGQRKIQMSCSMGAVVFPQQINNRFDVISSAEHSVQKAKENGRNQCFLFDPAILAKIDLQKEIEIELAQAIQNNQLSLAYQAKVTSKGKVIGSEALLRWIHPQKGFISPADFIPVAEESGLIHSLGEWVTNEVCRQIREWLDSGEKAYPVSINVAASQFNDLNFISYIFSTLKKYQLKTSYLEVELTETGLLTDVDRAIENINRLREGGITIALDDFGTGYSSLSYLQDLPFDTLKIDKSFVDKLGETRSDELIKSIIAICEHMNFKTVAEGTESLEQVNALVEMGCDCFQGYYFCRPMPAKDFMSYCLEQE